MDRPACTAMKIGRMELRNIEHGTFSLGIHGTKHVGWNMKVLIAKTEVTVVGLFHIGPLLEAGLLVAVLYLMKPPTLNIDTFIGTAV